VLRIFLLTIVLAILNAARVSAAPMLLMEFTHKVVTVESSATLSAPIPFHLEAYESGPSPEPVYFDWDDEYEASDVGMTFFAPEGVIVGANQAFASPRADYVLETGPANRLHVESNDTFCQPNACVMRHVPDLTNYRVTSVRRIIDQFEVDLLFEVFRGAQRIQFWGEQLPPVPAVPGDFNRNGSVDAADYVLWRNLHGQAVSLPNESGLNPGSVDIEDYWFWRTNFGRSPSSAAEALTPDAIPEPSSQELVLIVLVACFVWRAIR
jgi:hypothetical protein